MIRSCDDSMRRPGEKKRITELQQVKMIIPNQPLILIDRTILTCPETLTVKVPPQSDPYRSSIEGRFRSLLR